MLAVFLSPHRVFVPYTLLSFLSPQAKGCADYSAAGVCCSALAKNLSIFPAYTALN